MAKMEESKEVVSVQAFELPAPFDPNASWDELVSDADKALGTDLLKDELFDALVNVPFLIYRVTFYPGTVKPNQQRGSFAAVEMLIAPEKELKRRRVNIENLPFLPEDTVVANDGSTGIYRQLVQYLSEKGYIRLPEPITKSGPAGTSSYDLAVEDWAEIIHGTVEPDRNEDGRLRYSADVRIHCPRGIRLSEYTPEGLKSEAVTRYIA